MMVYLVPVRTYFVDGWTSFIHTCEQLKWCHSLFLAVRYPYVHTVGKQTYLIIQRWCHTTSVLYYRQCIARSFLIQEIESSVNLKVNRTNSVLYDWRIGSKSTIATISNDVLERRTIYHHSLLWSRQQKRTTGGRLMNGNENRSCLLIEWRTYSIYVRRLLCLANWIINKWMTCVFGG